MYDGKYASYPKANNRILKKSFVDPSKLSEITHRIVNNNYIFCAQQFVVSG